MEGPGVKVIAERLSFLKGKKIIDVGGNLKKFDPSILRNKTIENVLSHGKLLIIKIREVGFLRIHFLMYGSYSINKTKNKNIRLFLKTRKGVVYFYNCSIRLLNEIKFETKDILDKKFPIEKTIEKILERDEYICDTLLDQSLFPGVGNIIKVEALYRSKVHPLSKSNRIPIDVLKNLIRETIEFSKIFYKSRKYGRRLKNYTLCYGKRLCSFCGEKYTIRRLGNTRRITNFCENCQILYE